MAEGKWIDGLTPDRSLVEAARRVLPVRLEAVLNHLPTAIHAAAHDPEHVHQLRVATRRASAALRLFGDCLPGKSRRSLKESLRSIRRAAGKARDWDVFLQMLQQSPVLRPASAKAARDFLLGLQSARRSEAQRELATIEASVSEEFEPELRELSDKSFGWKEAEDTSIGSWAAEQIASLIDDFRIASTPPPADYESLHRLRILGKRLRYSMEIFADCFEPPLRQLLYPAVEQLQEILGAITDAHVASQRFIEIRDHLRAFQPKVWPLYRKSIEKLLLAQKRVFPRERKQFLGWLKMWRTLTDEWPVRSLVR